MNNKKYLVSALAFVMALLAAPLTVSAIPTTRLELSSAEIFVGESFQVNVFVDGLAELDDFGFQNELVSFGFDVDSGSFEYSGFGFDPAEYGFEDVAAFLPSTGVAGMIFPGVSGEGVLLATLNFNAVAAGSYSLGIVSDLFDPNEGMFTLFYPQVDMTTAMSVNVNAPVSSVPEPASLFLMGSGIIGLAVRRAVVKKKRRAVS